MLKVKNNKNRSLSSQFWLKRKLSDLYTIKAKKYGYRSRSVFKLFEIDKKYKLFHKNMHVIDLGSAPGSWLQYTSKKIGLNKSNRLLIGIDLKEIKPIIGCKIIRNDFLKKNIINEFREYILVDKVDLVMSDMAPSSTGHKQIDHLKIINLYEAALLFTHKILNQNGTFLVKILQGNQENKIINNLRKNFKKINYIKPKASYKTSKEIFILAREYQINN